MASRKRPPDTSRINRIAAVAYARKHKAGDADADPKKPDEAPAQAHAATPVPAAPAAPPEPGGAPRPGEGAKSATDNALPVPIEPRHPPTAASLPHAGDAPVPGEGPKSATHNELPTAAPATAPDAATHETIHEPTDETNNEPLTARAATVAMQPMTSVGAPPEIPAAAPATSGIEDPTHMPGPREIPAGDPGDPAAAPGRVPPGDSRSLRRDDAFALVYRRGTFVISRFGVVGTRGQWRVVEYPTSASASHAYAKECSRFVADGFSDYRE